MIGIVNSRRAPPGLGIPPRTSGNATMVPMIVARMATTIATRSELNSAWWMLVSASIAWYQCRVRPVIGKPGVFASSNENRTRKAMGR